jgi:hypothetical protein
MSGSHRWTQPRSGSQESTVQVLESSQLALLGALTHLCALLHASSVQAMPSLQPPQSSVPPQLSEIVPHSTPAGHTLRRVQPHWLGGPPPPHVSGEVHVPQESVLPQRSEALPQS